MVSNCEFPLLMLSTFSEVKVAFRIIPGNVISQFGPAGQVRDPAVMAHTFEESRCDDFGQRVGSSPAYISLCHGLFALSERTGIRDVVLRVDDLLFSRDTSFSDEASAPENFRVA